MKIDRTKLKKSSSEVPPDCKALIEKLKSCNHNELLEELSKIKTWNCGKCELYHWIDALDAFDHILEMACNKEKENQWCLPCDDPLNEKQKQLLLCVLQFTALLIEHSFSRHFYNSMEHLTTLLSSSDMNVVLAVLNLLYVFSKRSNFITRLNPDKRQTLLLRLLYLAESWGGKENGFGLAECCQNLPVTAYPSSASTLHFEYYAESSDEKPVKKTTNTIIAIHIDNVDRIPNKNPSQIMEDLIEKYTVPDDKQMQLFTHIRLAHSFSDYPKRMLCVQARLQALSVLVYCNAVPDNVNSLLYNGLIEELVDVLEIQDQNLIEIKAAALRTLTSIIHLDRNPKKEDNTVRHRNNRLNAIIDTTGASSYHGFLPVLVRNCIQSLTDPESEAFPLPFATALFSFLYHLASYESGGDALVSCGMMEALLKVINWQSTETEHITFVTRAVRVIDLITNLDMLAFQAHGGLASFIQRLEVEVNVCRKDQPFVIDPKLTDPSMDFFSTLLMRAQYNSAQLALELEEKISGGKKDTNTNEEGILDRLPKRFPIRKGVQCFPQRAALLKSMLNFLKKSIQDPALTDSIRHLMDGSLPNSLKHIISNAEYYGPSLFLLATDVVTVFIFQEPSLLHSLQNKGLTDVILHALLVKEVPATREVLASLPNVFGALCLNKRGLQSFVAYKPFEKLFRVLVSPEYLPAMRRRRSSDPIGDAASNLGNAVDELMRHQPSLRTDATAAIITLLEELCLMGRDPRFICTRPAAKPEYGISALTRVLKDAGSSDDEEEDEEDTGASPVQGPLPKSQTERGAGDSIFNSGAKTAVPLVDYILNVMRFVDAVLSNNSTDDHCREFVRQKGLVPLMAILGLPNLPIDFPITPTCQAVSSVCKSILNLAHEPQVLKQGLLHLNEVLQSLEHLHRPLEPPGGSVLLQELINAPNVNDATLSAQSTPLLHYMAAAHAYIIMFIHVCRTGQSDIRTISISHWGSELGLSVLKGLSSLYTSLVWESTVLLALCSNDTALAEDCQFGRQQLEKLVPKDSKSDKEDSPSSSEIIPSAVAETLNDSPEIPITMDLEDICFCEETGNETTSSDKMKTKPYASQIKQIKPLLSGASRLGRALAELFGLLVKLCVGSPMRQRRGQQIPPSPSVPSPAARAVATALTRLLAMGLSWEPPPASPVPKFRLTFYICSVGFTSPMLFDERKYPYHLMLQKFLSCGGLDAFFATFRWALTCGNRVPIEEGLEHPELPDGTGEFLDAWLLLLEKMVNPKNVLESPHTLPSKPNQQGNTVFNPLLYLIHVHKRAFESIMHLWDKKPLLVFGERIAESILTIICHILKGETIIKEKLAKGEDVKVPATPAATTTNPAPNGSATRVITRSRHLLDSDESTVNQDHLTQLVDMGFSRGLASEALMNTNSLEQATDYLLTYPAAMGRNTTSSNPSGLGMDWEMSEEDQMLRAIAMSLGENVLVSTNQVEGEQSKSDTQKEPDFVQQKEEPLSSQVIDTFAEKVVEGCLKLADALPETVYRCCDLLIAVAQRNGEAWRNRVLIDRLINEIHIKVYYLTKRLNTEQIPTERKGWGIGSKLPWIPLESKLAVRLHLLTLIFEESKLPVAAAIESKEVMGIFIQALELTASCMNSLQDEGTPKWLPFLVLLIDQYEKAAIMSKRKAPLLLAGKRQWKWFDERSGRWNIYTLSNNKLIDDAYRNGETHLRFTAGRRNYTVQLTTMVQINEETGNWRPIMLTTDFKEEQLKTDKPKADAKDKKDEAEEDSDLVSDSGSVQSLDMSYLHPVPVHMKVIKRLKSNQCRNLVRFCVMLMKVPLEPDTLHAIMRLCLRLTRKHCNAIMFATMDGPKTLLSLTQPYAFVGFTSITALLFRHILEDSHTLTYTMEKVIRSATVSGPSSLLVSKEMHYVFRVLGPAACRDPDIFTSVASSTLRLATLPLSKRDDDDSRFGNSSVQMLKSCPAKSPSSQTEYMYDAEVANNLIYDLLNALIAKPVEVPEDDTSSSESAAETLTASTEQQSPARENAANDLLPNDEDDGLVIPLTIPNVDGFSDSTDSLTTPRDNKSTKENSKDNKNESSSMKNVPIIRKSGICRLLAELVRSYVQCARLITDYSFHANDSELITEDCSALAFILDNLLHSNQTAGDKETPALARVLIAAIASCNHSVEAQTTLVNEVRLALLRALSLPESPEKHARVQALTALISTMIESCPAASSQSQLSGCALRSQTPAMNNIVRILLRKGIVVDLARIPHYLDLSSPHMAATVNGALKPLETLSRIVNLPSSHSTNKAKEKNLTSVVHVRGSVPETLEESASARCNADVTLPYRRNEVPSQDLSIDPTLEGFMNEILERREHSTPSEQGPSSTEQDLNVTVEVDDHTRPSIGGRRSSSFGDQAQDDQQESSDSESNSESGHSHSEDEAERDERVEDDEEEEEDVSRFEVGDDFAALDFFRVQDRDDSLFFQLEEVFPSSGGSSVIFGGSDAVRTFQIPVVTDESTSGNETPAPAVPPAPRSVTTVHPLLVRHGDSQCSLQPRVHRRQRGYRTNIGGHTWHMYATPNGNTSRRHPNPPVILQRHGQVHRDTETQLGVPSLLLGPNTAQDLLQLTSNFNSQPSSNTQSRVVFANSDFRILATEDEVFEIQDQSSTVSGDHSGTLSAIPSTLNRWAEESRVLDGDSIHDCIAGLKPTIIKCLETYRDDEMVERKEKRRKLHNKNSDKSSDVIVLSDTETLDGMGSTDGRTSSMEVAEPASQFESNISAARNIPPVNLSQDMPAQDLNSLSTERLAASIVEQVLGPALAITSNAGSLLPSRRATTPSDTRPSSILNNFMSSHIPEGPPRLHHFDFESTSNDVPIPSEGWISSPSNAVDRTFGSITTMAGSVNDGATDVNSSVFGLRRSTFTVETNMFGESERSFSSSGVEDCDLINLEPNLEQTGADFRQTYPDTHRRQSIETIDLVSSDQEPSFNASSNEGRPSLHASSAEEPGIPLINLSDSSNPSSPLMNSSQDNSLNVQDFSTPSGINTDHYSNDIDSVAKSPEVLDSAEAENLSISELDESNRSDTTAMPPTASELNAASTSGVEDCDLINLEPNLGNLEQARSNFRQTYPDAARQLSRETRQPLSSDYHAETLRRILNFMNSSDQEPNLNVSSNEDRSSLHTSSVEEPHIPLINLADSSNPSSPLINSTQDDPLNVQDFSSPSDINTEHYSNDIHSVAKSPEVLDSAEAENLSISELDDSNRSDTSAMPSTTSESNAASSRSSLLESSTEESDIPFIDLGDSSEPSSPVMNSAQENSINEEAFSRPGMIEIHSNELDSDGLSYDVDSPTSEREGALSTDTPEASCLLGAGIEIPEGVDPSFLAALPDNIRQEVIAEQLRLQRLRQRSQTVTNESNSDGSSFTEVNPEFLAALPPNIQEEVLAQQRAEQQRLAAQNSNPDAPVDPTSFIQTLPQGLRQQVLADMDDSLLAVLPPELASEAHALRRELEARHRQIQERFFSSHAGTALSRILRSAGRVGARYTIHSLPQRGQWTWNALSPRGTSSPSRNTAGLSGTSLTNSMRLRGRYLLDHEALACLLVLLFVDEPQLNTGRLHRVFRNLCHHGPTRIWVVKSLLSILERTNDYQITESPPDTHRHKKSKQNALESHLTKNKDSSNRNLQPSWLSISLDAALGCRTNVFQIRRFTTAHRRTSERHKDTTQKALPPNIPLVAIHPLASPVICRHVLDTLISLAKSFPIHFLPETPKDIKTTTSSNPKADEKSSKTSLEKSDKASSAKSDSSNSRTECDFWDVLVKLDSVNTTCSRKGKTALRTQSVISALSSSSTPSEDNSKTGGFKSSPLAQLIGLLAHPVVKRSSILTDRLLRLLALISLALPEPKSSLKEKTSSEIRQQISESQNDSSEPNSNVTTLGAENSQKKMKTGNKQDTTTNLEDNAEEANVMKHYLKLAVEVLTSKTCSEEGLEDATALLLRLSRGCMKTRHTVLYLLLDGARELGQSVCQNIRSLMYELKSLNAHLAAEKNSENEEKDPEYDGKFQLKGTIQDRFTCRPVVVTAPGKIKGRSGRELQLPSMSSFTSKASSQAFFLRILKVIIQLTESTQLLSKNKPLSDPDVSERREEGITIHSSSSDLPSCLNPNLPIEIVHESQDLNTSWDLNTKSDLASSKSSSEKDLKCLHLSSELLLDDLWVALSDCLKELAETPDHHAVLVLQPAVEAFFLVHASSEKDNKKKDNKRDTQESEISHLQDIPPISPLSSMNFQGENNSITSNVSDSASTANMSMDTVKFLKFAETHRTVLNQILRQSTTPLVDGPFSVLVDHTRVLDFDVKRRYFRQELERMDEGSRREDLAVHVRREHVFEDSFRELHRRTPEEWKNRFYIVFEGEEGQDAGGLLREWYTIISREIFNPMYALFTTSPGDRVTYMINSSSHCNSNHLSYFKFVGRVIAKAVYDNKLLESYFTRSFYKHILGKNVKYTDMESEDYSFYQGLVFLLEHGVNELGYELTFSVEVQEFGVTEIRDLKPNGRNLPVTEESKNEYVKLVCQEKMTGAIRKQLKAFLEGFYEIIPKRLISIFNEQELELLISGLPNIDIDDLKANSEYHKYQTTSLQIQWFWRALRSFDQADRANFLQFVTGTSKVPLQGFAALEGMNGTQKFQIHRDDRSTDRLPSAHTCFNQLDLPAYETYDKLRSMLLKAIHECSEGFGFA
nr:E3 ubiquitin-protein ligase HUWE1 [Parasteatoda tepidariorum]